MRAACDCFLDASGGFSSLSFMAGAAGLRQVQNANATPWTVFAVSSPERPSVRTQAQ